MMAALNHETVSLILPPVKVCTRRGTRPGTDAHGDAEEAAGKMVPSQGSGAKKYGFVKKGDV